MVLPIHQRTSFFLCHDARCFGILPYTLPRNAIHKYPDLPSYLQTNHLYVCMHICKYVLFVCHICVSAFDKMYACMYLCMYVCMYVHKYEGTIPTLVWAIEINCD